MKFVKCWNDLGDKPSILNFVIQWNQEIEIASTEEAIGLTIRAYGLQHGRSQGHMYHGFFSFEKLISS